MSTGRGQHGSSPLSFRGRAWKEQALLRQEGADRSFQGNTSQQLLPTTPMGSLPLHCDSKAGIRAVQEAFCLQLEMDTYLLCCSPEQHASPQSLRGTRGKASPAKSWLQGERSGTPHRHWVTPGLIRDLSQPHVCNQCCVCSALNTQCVTAVSLRIFVAPSGAGGMYTWRSAHHTPSGHPSTSFAGVDWHFPGLEA